MLKQHNLNLSVIGNSNINALIDGDGTIVWSCFPRMDGDPIFCSLLRNRDDIGFWKIELEETDHVKTEHEYIGRKPMVRTVLTDKQKNSLEIIDFAPRYTLFHRVYRPNTIVRCIKPLHGTPRITIRIHPTFAYGWGSPERTRGSNHIRYLLANQTVRLTTNVSISYIMNEVKFALEEPVYLIMMPDESLTISPSEYFVDSFEKTAAYWDNWSSSLNLPLEWQDNVIHASMILKLCSWEETGGIISAMTTSVATSPTQEAGSQRDLRYCFMRDAVMVVRSMNQLNITELMERYRSFVDNAKINHPDTLQAVYGIGLENRLVDKTIHRLAGYRGLCAVGVGTPEYRRKASETPGLLILSFCQFFFDKRCNADHSFYNQLEEYGDRCLEMYRKQSGKLELDVEEHRPATMGYIGSSESTQATITALISWAACDRLARVCRRLNMNDKAKYWDSQANELKAALLDAAYSFKTRTFNLSFGGTQQSVDSSIFWFWKFGFLGADDERMKSTLKHVESKLLMPHHGVRQREGDPTLDFAATFEYIQVLFHHGRKDEARALFQSVIKLSEKSNGTLSEKWHPETGELWGNFPCAIAMAAMIDCALLLSEPWARAA